MVIVIIILFSEICAPKPRRSTLDYFVMAALSTNVAILHEMKVIHRGHWAYFGAPSFHVKGEQSMAKGNMLHSSRGRRPRVHYYGPEARAEAASHLA